jgi:protein-tyrosine phosphatase
MFVCTANVCRSPLMAFTFADAVRSASNDDEWAVRSGGVAVKRPSAMCSVAAGLLWKDSSLWKDAAGHDFVLSHVATAIRADDLDVNQLILTASREERGAIARLRPDLRRRTFTLNEAVALGRNPLAFGEVRGIEARVGERSALAVYAEVLNGRRGGLSVPAPSKLRLPWTTVPHVLDIPDVHHDGSRRHANTLKELQVSVHALHQQIDAFLTRAAAA